MKNRKFRSLPRFLPGGRGLFVALFLSLALLFGFLWALPTTAQEPLEPPAKPNAESALSIFNDRCANCHGPEGRGNGELVANLPAPPRDYSDQAFLNAAVPATLFQTLTQGRLEAGMPPFGPSSTNPIADGDRWNLVAMVYSLGTSSESIANGGLVYEQSCASCHGEDGAGDGPQAAEQISPPTDLTDLRYWTNRSNDQVIAALADTAIEAHTYDLSGEEIGDVVNFARTFSYDYYDPIAALEPIPAATISGLVTNESTGEILTEGVANLRAFTQDFEEKLNLEASLGPDGRFSFDLEDVSPELVFLTTVKYGDLTFNSNPARLERSNPTLDMPVAVFEKTTNPEAVSIGQIHLVLEFAEDRLVVSEIYVLNNNESAVFVGESGAAADGTIQLGIPEGAESVNFQRSFDSFGNFLPATEFIRTEDGWADTIPMRPGESAMNLLVTYDLPYDNELDFSHPLFYDAANATVVMPDVGVSLEGSEWQDQGTQQMGSAGAFNSFGHPSIPGGEILNFTLQGRPSRAASTSTAATVGSGISGDSTTGLLIGAGVLLLVVVGGVFMVRTWQNPAPVMAGNESQREQLLQSLADLDDEFDSGKIEEDTYTKQRETLLAELVAVWQE